MHGDDAETAHERRQDRHLRTRAHESEQESQRRRRHRDARRSQDDDDDPGEQQAQGQAEKVRRADPDERERRAGVDDLAEQRDGWDGDEHWSQGCDEGRTRKGKTNLVGEAERRQPHGQEPRDDGDSVDVDPARKAQCGAVGVAEPVVGQGSFGS